MNKQIILSIFVISIFIAAAGELVALKKEPVPVVAVSPQAIATSTRLTPRLPLYPPPSKKYFQEIGQTTSTLAYVISPADPVAANKLHDKYRVSPDGKYRVMTESSESGDANWIVDMHGNKLTPVQEGFFIGWTPDSKYAMFSGILYLGIDGKATRSGVGGFSGSVSPIDGSIVYSDECCGTNDSELRIKDSRGNDTVLIERGRYIISWEVWSPKGNKIAFLKGNPSLADSSIWIINPDGTGLKKISGVDWDYPPVWSNDSAQVMFTYNNRIWAFDIASAK